MRLRWPIRSPFRRATLARMGLALALAVASATAAEKDPLDDPANRLDPGAPAWKALAESLGRTESVTAEFVEKRFFAFRSTPTQLKGMVRVSSRQGLSLHYLSGPVQTVIIDERGMLVRTARGDSVPPADPRASAANSALLRILRFDFAGLAADFELAGLQQGPAWTVSALPRAAGLRNTLGRITVSGEGPAVRRIEMRRSATQRVEIEIAPPLPSPAFSAEESRLYFR